MAEVVHTSGGKAYVASATALFVKAFETDPVILWLLSSMVPEARTAYLPQYFNALLTAAAMNEASFMEANNWESCSVLMPPGKRVDNTWTMLQAGFVPVLWNIGVKGVHRMLGEYVPKTDAAKKKGLAGQKRYYYVFFTATREDGRGKGLCSATIRHQQEMATRDGLPVWLEATTAHSMKIYAKLDFQTVDEIKLGAGKVDASGNPCKGGDGVRIWAMIWWPEKH